MLGLSSLGAGALRGSQRADFVGISFLDVGQGDSALIQDAGAAVLIDCGPSGAGRFIHTKIRRMGILNLSAIILSHPDLDHVGGLRYLAHRNPSCPIYMSAAYKDDPKTAQLLAWAEVTDRIRWVNNAVLLQVGTTQMTVVAPPWNVGEPDNEGSLFVRVDQVGSRAVLTGDANGTTEEAERNLLAWKADLLKCGHHGSRKSASDAWLDTVQPQNAVISCGLNNRYGHPSKYTVNRLMGHKVKIFRTDKDGDLVFRATSAEYEVDLVRGRTLTTD